MKHLLIIEDDQIDQMAFERFANTEDFNYSYKIARSIKEAKEALKTTKFDAVISDYFLGDGNAFEILEMEIDIPIIVTTGTGSEEIAVNALKKGAYDYLIKDVDGFYLKMLPITVQNALHRFQTEKELNEYHTNLKTLIEQKTVELRKEIKINNVLYQISNAVNTTKNTKQLLKLIRTTLSSIIDTTNFYIALLNEHSEKIELSFFEDEKDRFIEIPTNKTITNYIIETEKPLLVSGKQLQQLAKENNFEIKGTLPKIWIGVPLNIGGKVMGALAVQSYKDNKAFNEEDKNLLVFVSDQIGLSIQNKKNEENLKSALEKATESDNLKTAFLHNISHEIRTPMNGILGFTSLLKNTNLSDEKQQTYIDIITKSGERMLNTLYDLMDMSKLETGQVTLNLTQTNINEELEILYAFFKNEAQNKGLLFHLKVPKGNIQITVSTDREKLYAILSNLIKNALKFTAIGGVEFGYTIKGDFIEFYIMDSGIGIPKNRQTAIFNRFVQADIHDTNVYEGSGLGLSISKSYIELLGGIIWVESNENDGSKFYFTLPLNKEVVSSSSKILSELETDFFPSSKKINVLIVEDDQNASIYLSIILEDYCKNIYRAIDGIEALNIFKENPTIDLILMDIKLPDLNGYEVTKQIRNLNKNVVIIAQTAFAQNGDREKAISVGCTDYVSKPVDERLLYSYDRIRNSYRNGLAVVAVERDACGGCFNSIPPQRQSEIRLHKKIIVCENCGRILVESEMVEKGSK